jgi:hypothetical protein
VAAIAGRIVSSRPLTWPIGRDARSRPRHTITALGDDSAVFGDAQQTKTIAPMPCVCPPEVIRLASPFQEQRLLARQKGFSPLHGETGSKIKRGQFDMPPGVLLPPDVIQDCLAACMMRRTHVFGIKYCCHHDCVRAKVNARRWRAGASPSDGRTSRAQCGFSGVKAHLWSWARSQKLGAKVGFVIQFPKLAPGADMLAGDKAVSHTWNCFASRHIATVMVLASRHGMRLEDPMKGIL